MQAESPIPKSDVELCPRWTEEAGPTHHLGTSIKLQRGKSLDWCHGWGLVGIEVNGVQRVASGFGPSGATNLQNRFFPMTGNSEMCVKTVMKFNLCLTQQTNKKKEFGHKKQKNTKNNNKGLILLTVSKCSISCHSIASCGGNSVWNPSKIAICNAGAVHILMACLYTHKHTKEITGQPN